MVALELEGMRRTSVTGLRENIRFPEGIHPKVWAIGRVALLFLLVLVGVAVSFYWGPLWAYQRDSSKALDLGSTNAFLVRIGLSLVISLLTFTSIYSAVQKTTSESWVPFLLAFQNGFAWQSLLQGIIKPPA
jgi:hypothetical protein